MKRSCRKMSSHVKGPTWPKYIVETIPAMLRKTTNLYPDREAAVFSFPKQRYSFQQIEIETNKIAAGLLALGLKPGDRLALWYVDTQRKLIK